MAKHDEYIYFKGMPKELRFKPPQRQGTYSRQLSLSPQIPRRKTGSANRYLGHGKGV